MKQIAFFTIAALLCCITFYCYSQDKGPYLLSAGKMLNGKSWQTYADTLHPLDKVCIAGAKGKFVVVSDGTGNAYFRAPVQANIFFTIGGALGKHSIAVLDAKRRQVASLTFIVDAKTNIDDGGYYRDMFDLFYNGMWTVPNKTGSVIWNGKLYHFFVPWVLDDDQTMKGLKYFSSIGAEFVDMCREAQREDGMIWSFVQDMPNVDYFLTRDKYTGYSRRIGDRVFVRQPVLNHDEYLFVNALYQCWKATGDKEWMKNNLAAAAKALDYSVTDPARWSNRFGLLKRVYSIDSWDFAVEDEYLPDLGLTNSMIIDPVKSKFGVFFGDNTGYITACGELAEMFDKTNQQGPAAKYRDRGNEIRKRLDKLAWNRHFYTHFIEEDSTVKRHLGVDERSQIAQSNAYSLNRDIDPANKKAIIETYLNLKTKLPVGSPGEWYAIYPPFQKGFGAHNSIWQYMNGGVGGHVAGELARGAFENGYESYAVDILDRLFELGKKYDHKIYFSYSGSISPPPPAPAYRPLNLIPYANMDFERVGSKQANRWMMGTRQGDDFHDLPVGDQTFNNIRFNIIEPAKNERKAVVAVSHLTGLPAAVEIPVNDTAASIYLLHTASKPSSENIVGNVTFVYTDSTKRINYVVAGKQLTYWWFSELKTDYSGIAWYGKNKVSEGIGLSWCAIDNPEPSKTIAKIILEAPADNGIYTVFGITLSNRPHYVPVNPVSFGGPDNWAAATAMAAMVEGLAGVKDAMGTEAFSSPVIAPRWDNTTAKNVNVLIRYAASKGYVAYQYEYQPAIRKIKILVAGNGRSLHFHIILPDSSKGAKYITANNKNVSFTNNDIGKSVYSDFEVSGNNPVIVLISY